MAGVFIPEASITFMQDDEDNPCRSQTLKINFVTQGAGMYAVLSTKKWSVCDSELNALAVKIDRIAKIMTINQSKGQICPKQASRASLQT